MNLLVVCALAFGGFLGLALLAILYVGSSAERTAKQSRLGEVGRYRVLGAVALEQAAAPTTAQAEGAISSQALALIDRVARARGQRGRLVNQLERTGLRMRPEEWAAIQIAVVVVGAALVAFALSSPIGLPLGALAGCAGLLLFISIKGKRRVAAFEANLPDSLQLLAGALRAGFTLNQAIGSVAREGTEPTASEFGRVLTEVRLGAELEDALDSLAERLHSYDMELVVMAIRTAREVGGNLAEVLQTTAGTMRERVNLHRQVEVLSAEGKLSAKILVALPFLMAAYLFFFKGDYLKPLYSSGVGIALLVGGVVLLAIGITWLSRIVKIEV